MRRGGQQPRVPSKQGASAAQRSPPATAVKERCAHMSACNMSGHGQGRLAGPGEPCMSASGLPEAVCAVKKGGARRMGLGRGLA